MTTITEPGPATGKPTKVKPTRSTQGEKRFGRRMILPALVVAIVVTQVPLVVTLYYSFQNWNLARPGARSFAGVDNYIAVVRNGVFLPVLLNTVVVIGSSTILSLIFGLLLAVLLDRKFRGRAIARTLLITPFLVMPAASALIWKWSLLDANVGMINWALGLVKIPAVAWNSDYPGMTVVFVLTWQFTPFMMLILLAGLQSQSSEIIEAAQVDGAGPVRIFRTMTLPHLRSYAELGTLLGTVLMVQLFDPINIMTKGAGHSKTLPYLLYERAFIGQQVGEAAAYGVVSVIVIIAIAMVALRTMFRVFTEEGGGG